MLFQQNINIPEFASYDLLRNEQGYKILFDYYAAYAKLGRKYKIGLVLETPTWRANPDWGRKIGDSQKNLDEFNALSVKLLEQIRSEYAIQDSPIVISGNIGPRGDGYVASDCMTVTEAQDYHTPQISVFAASNADLVSAITLNYIEEAIGVSLAAKAKNVPVCISFTVETDGKIPTGETLKEAISAVDQATGNAPAYYMINCAHPTHFDHLLKGEDWLSRIKGVRANASRLSHAELDESEQLDEGNPNEFGQQCCSLKSLSPYLNILGGCCGTDHRHIEQICKQLAFARKPESSLSKQVH